MCEAKNPIYRLVAMKYARGILNDTQKLLTMYKAALARVSSPGIIGVRNPFQLPGRENEPSLGEFILQMLQVPEVQWIFISKILN